MRAANQLRDDNMPSVYDFTVTLNNGETLPLASLKGKVLVIFNTASRCGFTPQYEGLEKLWLQYKDKDVVLIGFPCNQFGSQEPGTDADIAQFCDLNYNVTFPMSVKVDVNGDNAAPLFNYLKDEARGVLGTKGIKWNFTKFVVDKNATGLRQQRNQKNWRSLCFL